MWYLHVYNSKPLGVAIFSNPSVVVGLIALTFCFKSNAHQLVILLQSVEQNYRVVTYFYAILEIHYDESAKGLLDLLISDFERNGILEKIKKNLGKLITKWVRRKGVINLKNFKQHFPPLPNSSKVSKTIFWHFNSLEF